MGTEITPTRRNINTAIELDGRPVDNGLYTPSTDQKYHFAKKILTWDGKLFKYAYFGGIVSTGRGNVFYNAIPATGIDYSAVAADAAVGDTSILMTNQNVVAQTVDCMAGGHITINALPSDTTNANLQQRTIVGNDAAPVSGSPVCRIYLDSPLNSALTAGVSYAFAMPSPYSDIRYISTSGTMSFAGPAAAYSIAAKFGFVQVYGKCWLAPQSGIGTTAYYRTCYWRHDGTVDKFTNIGTNVTDQRAGYIMDNNTAANGSTVIMLQGDVY